MSSHTGQSAFSAWLRRCDTTLAGEKSNALFQAFRLRRTIHGRAHYRRLEYWLRSDFGPVLSAIIILTALQMLGLPPNYDHVIVFGLLAAYAGGLAMLAARYFRGSATTWVPATFAEVMSQHRDSDLMRELMLIPADGRVVAECLYLESRERIPLIVSALPCAMLVAVALWLGVNVSIHLASLAAGLAAALLGVGVQIGRDLAVANMRGIVETFESAHAADWRDRRLPRYPANWSLMENGLSATAVASGAGLYLLAHGSLGSLAILPALLPGLVVLPIQARLMQRIEPVIAVAYRRAELAWPGYARIAILKDPPAPEETVAGQPGHHP